MLDQRQQPTRIGGDRPTIGDLAPKLAEITDDVLLDDVWHTAASPR